MAITKQTPITDNWGNRNANEFIDTIVRNAKAIERLEVV